MSDYAITINNLSKQYALKNSDDAPYHALDNVSLAIKKGSIFGLLGPNGAGKSTLINILAGLVVKTSGQVNIWDIDIDDDHRRAKSCIGIVPQELNMDPFFTPYQALDLQAGLYGIPKKKRRTDEILRMVDLHDKANAYARDLSGGMRRRLLVAKAMVHSPPILVLDEPTAGVDIELRRKLWKNVVELNKKGVTILLTTHYLEEAQELCDDIAILSKGKLIVHDDKHSLMQKMDVKHIRIAVPQHYDHLQDNTIEDCLLKQYKEDNQHIIDVQYKPSRLDAGKIIALLQGHDIAILDISTQEPDLEDIFMQYAY